MKMSYVIRARLRSVTQSFGKFFAISPVLLREITCIKGWTINYSPVKINKDDMSHINDNRGIIAD